MTYTQTTYVNGELKYEPKVRTADEMVEYLTQLIRLKDAGEDIEMFTKVDSHYNIKSYTVIRKGFADGRVVTHEIVVNR